MTRRCWIIRGDLLVASRKSISFRQRGERGSSYRRSNHSRKNMGVVVPRNWWDKRVCAQYWVRVSSTRVDTEKTRSNRMVIWRMLKLGTARRAIISSTRGRREGWWCNKWFTPHVPFFTLRANLDPMRGTSNICEDHLSSRRGGGSRKS
jgi:hypothetical protein